MDAPNAQILGFGEAAIARGAELIRAGQIVAVPTETVYGLAADATNGEAVARVYAAKGRPSFNPLIVHVPDRATAEMLAAFDARARALADAFWPGPLTLVLPKRDSAIAGLVTAGLETIAIRVPAHRAMRALLKASGKPLAAPSANASGGISPTRADHVAASLGSNVPLIIDDGAPERGIESTIVREVFGSTKILRHGPITTDAIRAVLAKMLPHGITHEPHLERFDSSDGEPDMVEAPGQLASHYAPRKPLRIDAPRAAPDEWMIGFGPTPGDDTLSASGDLEEAAARLFDALHRADASPKPKIAIAPVPDTGIGEAINDRLRRAAYREAFSQA
jgi:L-threonylcarbamoyladenylate synthase